MVVGSESVAVAGDAHPERPPSDPGRVAGPFGEGFGEGPPNLRPGLVPFVSSTVGFLPARRHRRTPILFYPACVRGGADRPNPGSRAPARFAFREGRVTEWSPGRPAGGAAAHFGRPSGV